MAYVERNRQWLAAMTKVKSHSGNRWNEYVDGLCAKAIQGVPSEASIRSLALEVLGDADQVELWLGQALPALGGKTPADCLGDRDGPVQVERVLRAIQWGIYL
ncbi:MAG: DUF2384 domain-containing protein [Opitutales bacterium]|nr:DUF2384 domain-containing protein [Opitutales bacterium]